MIDPISLERARDALQAFRLGSQRKPLFVEFSGTPKSGKSNCIDIVTHFFRRAGFRIHAPSEGASKRTPYYLKQDLVAFNTWSASYALQHVLQGLHSPDNYDLAILDRGLFDALAWFELLQLKGDITVKERDQVQAFLCIDDWRNLIDLVLLITTDPETSLKRENQDTLTSEEGRAMNPETLQQLNTAYDSVKKRYSTEFSEFRPIDTSAEAGTTPRSTASEAAALILDLLESKTR